MKRTYVRIELRMESPWRVGAWSSEAADTMAVLTDPDGKPVAPGAGIAGSLRHAIAPENARELFGPAPGDKELTVSPWWVLGTQVLDAEVTQRQRNRINRVRGSADNRGLFRVEEVGPKQTGRDQPHRTRVVIHLRREHGTANPDEIITPLLDALHSWNPHVGGGTSVGMGRATITEVVHRTLDLTRPDDLAELVCAGGDRPAERVDRILGKGSRVAVDALQPPAPLLRARAKVDFLAVAGTDADRIHGSTWKGLLRSRVEYIGRSLGHAVCGAPSPGASDQDGQWTGCGDCAVCRVFGSTSSPGRWIFEDSPFAHPPEPDAQLEERQRIAIDRFTGGVRSGALWPQQYVQGVELDLVIRSTPSGAASITGSTDEWPLAALLHALRDLDDGLIALGPEGAAGYGSTRVIDVVLDGEHISLDELPPVPSPSDEGGAS